MSASVALAADPPPAPAAPPPAAPAEPPPAPPQPDANASPPAPLSTAQGAPAQQQQQQPPPTPEQYHLAYQRYLREMKLREPTVKVRPWYGWKNLIAVGASDALLLGSIATAGLGTEGIGVPFGYAALGCRVFCGSILHWAHGHVARGFGSLLINGGVPLSMLALGFAMEDREAAYGVIVLGLFAAPGIDAGLLAFDDEVEVPRSELQARRSPLGIQSMAVLPILQKNQLGLSFVGQF